MNEQIKELMSALDQRHIPCSFAKDRVEAMKEVLAKIPENSTVGIGGSETINQLNIEDPLKEKGCEIHWHWRAKDREDSMSIRHRALVSETYLCSANAISMDGRLVNIDGTGNRVTSMVFGPKKVIIVIGKNKIAENFDAALKRVKDVACPLNARRLKLKTPCAITGKCTDCKSPDRMCNVTTIIEGKPKGIDMHIVIVGEDMGY